VPAFLLDFVQLAAEGVEEFAVAARIVARRPDQFAASLGELPPRFLLAPLEPVVAAAHPDLVLPVQGPARVFAGPGDKAEDRAAGQERKHDLPEGDGERERGQEVGALLGDFGVVPGVGRAERRAGGEEEHGGCGLRVERR